MVRILKKVRYSNISALAERAGNYTIREFCAAHTVSRQAYYLHQNAVATLRFEEEIVLQCMKAIRHRQPQIGRRKLLYLLQQDFEKADFEYKKTAEHVKSKVQRVFYYTIFVWITAAGRPCLHKSVLDGLIILPKRS